jgi:hypothetical protein
METRAGVPTITVSSNAYYSKLSFEGLGPQTVYSPMEPVGSLNVCAHRRCTANWKPVGSFQGLGPQTVYC